MQIFTERHAHKIAGTLSCFDRILVQGTLPDICHPGAITGFFYRHRMKIFDYTAWASPYRDRIRAHIEALAEAEGLEIEFVRKTGAMRKGDHVQEIVRKRGEHPGLVHILSAMESCTSFRFWHNKENGKTYFTSGTGRCLHYYIYFIDPEYGLCHLRVPTWAPFRLQFYCNGHSWLARQLQKKGIDFVQVDNAFTEIAHFDKAQTLADRFAPKRLHKLLNRLIDIYVPALQDFHAGVHWSVMQAEYATDIVFEDRKTLRPLYEELVRTLCHAVHPDHVAMFLGKRLNPRYEGELDGEFHTRIEGHCLRHHMGKNGIKIYDKLGRILRMETYSNDISFFKHHRRVEHRDGTWEYKTANMRKTIYSLPDLAKAMAACNRRYLEFLSAVDDPTNAIRKIQKVSCRVRDQGRSFGGFNLFGCDDEAVFRAIAQAPMHCFGMSNRHLRAILPGKSAGQISHIIKRLRKHGILKKVANRYNYYLTTFGKEVVAAALKLKEMFLVPLLRGHLNAVC